MKSKVIPIFIILPYSTLLKGVDELEMNDYTRKDSNIRVYIDFERYKEGGELFNFFALKRVQNATFENEVFAWWEKVKVAVFDVE